MRIVSKKRAAGDSDLGIIYGGIALLALLAGRFVPVLDVLPGCAFQGMTGVPCLTCGATRSIVGLASGNILDSLSINPLISLAIIAGLSLFLYSLCTLLFNLPRKGFSFSHREKSILRIAAVLLVLANWVYLIVTM